MFQTEFLREIAYSEEGLYLTSKEGLGIRKKLIAILNIKTKPIKENEH